MSLEVVVGHMFSGKSSYALSYIRRQQAIGKTVMVIKPNIDNRYADDCLATHNGEKIKCLVWDVSKPLCAFTKLDYDCFVVEEAQFFTHLEHFCFELLTTYKKNILIVGLDADANQRKFGEILDVIPLATSVTKLSALCSVCKDGTPAPYTKSLHENNLGKINIGGAEKYAAVCLRHLINV